MSRLQELIDAAYEGVSAVDRAYTPLPLSIANACGVDEVRELVDRLDALSVEREELPTDDGDARDDVWRAQERLTPLLAELVERFPEECAATLHSPHSATRFWGARAMHDSHSRHVVDALDAALARETDEPVREMLTQALEACGHKRGWLSRWFG
ncbi:MAG: hypothetical protein H6825_06580 [Planctomycetes bacterium]|nr:hypothetical protein [Planctomycetota bacterium]